MESDSNHLGETVRECAAKLIRYSGGVDGARLVAWNQLLYYRRMNKEDTTEFYSRVLSLLSEG